MWDILAITWSILAVELVFGRIRSIMHKRNLTVTCQTTVYPSSSRCSLNRQQHTLLGMFWTHGAANPQKKTLLWKMNKLKFVTAVSGGMPLHHVARSAPNAQPLLQPAPPIRDRTKPSAPTVCMSNPRVIQRKRLILSIVSMNWH